MEADRNLDMKQWRSMTEYEARYEATQLSARHYIYTMYCPQFWVRFISQASNAKLQFNDIFHCDDEWTGLEVPIGNDTMIYSIMMMSGLG